MLYSKKTSPDGIFTCVKNNPISTCDNHEIIKITQEGQYNYHFITYKCKLHDEVIKHAKSYVLSKGCVACNKESLRKKRENLFLKHLKNAGVASDFEILSKYENAKVPIKIRHIHCGNIMETTSDKFTRSFKCLHCENPMCIINTMEQYKDKYDDFYKAEGFEILNVKTTKNFTNNTKFKIKHLTCGNISTMTHASFIHSGSRCRYCNGNVSRVHAIVEATIKANNLNYEPEFRFDDCKNKYTLPFDFKVYLPNDTFILVEVDGQQHYKEGVGVFSNRFDDIKKNDNIKNKYCEDNHITLHRVKVEDFTTIQEVFDHLKTILPISKKPDYRLVDGFHSNKITAELSEKIREEYISGFKMVVIGEKYSIHSSSVSKVLHYKIYPDIKPEWKAKIKKMIVSNSNKPPRRPSQLLPYKKEIFKMRDIDGLTYSEIGEKYGVSGTCVRTFYIRNS